MTVKRMYRAGAALAALVLLLTFLAVSVNAAAGDEVRAPKKIISIVYDDSSSMIGDKWIYCNYAMQGLVSLLNEEDELYITKMSDCQNAAQINLHDIVQSVSNIRRWYDHDMTPAAAIDTAREKLNSITESDPSTQFWLVVLTDGEFQNLRGDLQDVMNRHKGAVMSNGSTLNVIYTAFGGAKTISKDEGRGLYALEAKDSKEIRDTLTRVANLISGRLTVDQKTAAGNDSVTFSSSLPLYSISVLVQDSEAHVIRAETQEEPLHVSRVVQLDASRPPEHMLLSLSSLTLHGSANVINKEENGLASVIMPGTYTLTFSEPVNAADLLIQYEPAIGVKLAVKRNGVVISDTDDFQAEDKVEFSLIPVIPGTDDEIASGDLPKGISWRLEYEIDGVVQDFYNGSSLTEIELEPGENVLRGIMQIPGFAPVIYEKYFRINEIVWELGIITDQPEPLSYDRGNPEAGKKGGVRFTVTNEGVPLDRETLNRYALKLEVESVDCDASGVKGILNRFGSKYIPCSLEMNKDGTFSLTPRKGLWPAFMIRAGDYTVTVRLNKDESVQAEGVFRLTASLGDWIDLFWVLIALVFFLYVLRILTKRKFPNRTVMYREYRQSPRGAKGILQTGRSRSLRLSPLTGGLLNPFRKACVIDFGGIRLVAGRFKEVYAEGKSLEKYAAYGTSVLNPELALTMIANGMRPPRPNEVPDMPVDEKGVYYKTDAGANVSRVYLQ